MRDARLLVDTLQLTSHADAATLATAWSRANAAAIVRLAAFEGVSLWLHRRLRALGVALAGEAVLGVGTAAVGVLADVVLVVRAGVGGEGV